MGSSPRGIVHKKALSKPYGVRKDFDMGNRPSAQPQGVRLPRLLGCFRCGHRWLPRHSPIVRCPKCKSEYWAQPRPPKRGRPPKAAPDPLVRDEHYRPVAPTKRPRKPRAKVRGR
jgi:DNA-directed RNA polymerase subunit RPC12/RpoP